MASSRLVPIVVLSVALTVSAMGQSVVPAESAPTQVTDSNLLETVRSLNTRVAELERRLAIRQQHESIGNGLIQLETIVTNLNSDRLNRFISVAPVIAVANRDQNAAAGALVTIKPRIKNWLYGYLADKTIKDVTGGQNQATLRVEIRTGINKQLAEAGYPEYAQDVLFDSIAVQ